MGVDRYKAVNQHRERKTVLKKNLIKKSHRKEMETPIPQIELSCVVAVAVFLERRPEAERMEHTAWNCFLNRFFFF